MVGKVDRLALANPSLEAVGGNVVSTGLGALEILGKRAVDVISDVVSCREMVFLCAAVLHVCSSDAKHSF